MAMALYRGLPLVRGSEKAWALGALWVATSVIAFYAGWTGETSHAVLDALGVLWATSLFSTVFRSGRQNRFYGFVTRYTMAIWLFHGICLALYFHLWKVAGISIAAAGYAGGYFHIQICRGDATQTDNHARLWLEGPEGTKCLSLGSIGFCRIQDDGSRADYTEFLFDVAPEALSRYTLHGDFYTASHLTEGLWQVTFPLVETP